MTINKIEEAPLYWEQGGGVKLDAATGYCNGWNDCVAAYGQQCAATRHSAEPPVAWISADKLERLKDGWSATVYGPPWMEQARPVLANAVPLYTRPAEVGGDGVAELLQADKDFDLAERNYYDPSVTRIDDIDHLGKVYRQARDRRKEIMDRLNPPAPGSEVKS